MNRRDFFAVVAGLFASLSLSRLLPASPSFGRVKVTKLPDEADPKHPPVVYKGDPRDPKYHRVMDGRHKEREGMRFFLNGEDRTNEIYESYFGDKGWVNVFVKTRGPNGKLRAALTPGGNAIRAGYYGKVEMKAK